MNKQLHFGTANIVAVLQRAEDAKIRMRAILSETEARGLHVQRNGFKAYELKTEFASLVVKLVPPKGLEQHSLTLHADQARRFKVVEKELEEGKGERSVLEFTVIIKGLQFEAQSFMKNIGAAACSCDLTEAQAQLPFPAIEGRAPKSAKPAKPLPKATIRDAKNKDRKKLAAGDADKETVQ